MATGSRDFQRALDMFLSFDILEIDRIDHFGFVRDWVGQVCRQWTLARQVRRQIGQRLYWNHGHALDQTSLRRILEWDIDGIDSVALCDADHRQDAIDVAQGAIQPKLTDKQSALD